MRTKDCKFSQYPLTFIKLPTHPVLSTTTVFAKEKTLKRNKNAILAITLFQIFLFKSFFTFILPYGKYCM